jgi:hypothetical protein
MLIAAMRRKLAARTDDEDGARPAISSGNGAHIADATDRDRRQ